MKKRNVLLGVTGSIAAYKACDIVRRLQDKDCDVSVVMTACAEKFVTPLTFEALSRGPVYREMFSSTTSAEWDMAHISLAKWADAFVIAPATANMIGKLASGIADDLLTCTAVAMKAPILIAPAMNTDMLTARVVQDNIVRLKKYGIKFIEPQTGRLACGDVGIGALADVDVIVKTVVALF